MKTIHPIPPAGSEEALIQALETLLAQENPDEARLQALLDQLDRQTGAAPLDPEAGWADLQRRRSARPKRRGLRRFPLALAAVLVCLAVSGTALAVNFGLHEKLADLFQVNESNQTLVADAIIFEASLTFIGAGIQEPTATWGNILADARGGVLAGRWWQALFPGLAIMITCLALNILSEGITDAMAAAPSAALDPTDSSKRREADLLVSDPVRAYKEQAQSLSARLGALRDVELKRDDRHVPDESVEPLLSVRDFCIQFEHHGDINVVDHVNFDVRPGQTMGLVGESGCGKSITTLAIMGLTDDDEHLSGEVLWEGRDLLKMSKKEWFGLRGTDIAMVYQDALSSLNPSMLISAQMKQLTKRGGTRSAEELLELVGLDPKRTLESYPHELSGGQRQRVLIAMALTRDPKLVICDEPTTALDVTVQKQVIKLLNDLQAKLGFAMIFVSHDLALVAEVAHNITVMYAGQVIEQAPTKELLTNPIHEYTRGLLGSVLSIESGSGRLHQVPGAVPSPRDFPKGDRFAPRSSHPRIGLDTRPVFKRVPGTEHFYSELPDEVLKANGLTPHAEVM